ncbi:HTH-type transcriptional activator IlvY [Spirochaetia bacterium 38H-sp]|uniref:HTH-type transcriptional activator IlvY n=1 Tax=Rarispira pelagica TaxID=3141764 RepID=A0ABU9UBM7_9SPIR
MNIEDLSCFIALAETLHFGRASKLCNLSPSAFSRAIKRLEEETNSVLIRRDTRRVELTQEGRLFFDRARSIIDTWEAARSELARMSGMVSGELSIFASVTACYSLLPGFFTSFTSSYPDVHIRLETGAPAEALPAVLDDRVDIGVIAKPDSLPRDVDFFPVVETPLVFVAPAADCPLTRELKRNGPLSLPLILPEREPARLRLDRWFSHQKMSPRVYAEVAGNEAILAMVNLGLGIGVVPRLVLEKSPLKQGIKIVDTEPPLEPYLVGFAVKKRRKSLPAVYAFLECVNKSK